MDLIDRQAMMNYIRSNKINIGQVAHIVIMKQKSVNAVSEEVYTREYNLRKDAEFKVYKLEKAIDEIKAEIMEQFEGCDICRWDEDYDYEENNISEYKYIDSICSILKIIDEKVKEQTDGNNNRSRDAEI